MNTYAYNATAIVLAGGLSTRMGRDKAMLPFGGIPLIERTLRQLRGRFIEVLVSIRTSGDYPFITDRKVVDKVPGQGPLAAIAASLERSSSDLNFIVSCDVPDLSFELIQRLLEASAHADGAVAVSADGTIEPLFAVYRKSLGSAAQGALDRGQRKVSAMYLGQTIAKVPIPLGYTVRNLNTMADYRAYCADSVAASTTFFDRSRA